MLVLGFAYVLDQWRANFGFWTVVVLFVCYVPYWWFSLRRLNSMLNELQQTPGDQ